MSKKKSLWIVRQFADFHQWAGRHKFWAVVVYVFLLWLLVTAGQIAVERYSFYRIEKNLENLLSTLPNGEKSDREIETVHRCGRGSAKFSAGPLRCSVEKKATYQLNEFDNPKQIYPEIYDHINSLDYVFTDDEIILQKELRRLRPNAVSNEVLENILPDFEMKNFDDFSCSMSLKNEIELVDISISCSRDARVEFFKITND